MSDKRQTLSVADRYNLDEMDKRILKLKLEHPRMTDREIGELVQLARENVNMRRNKPAFKAAITEYLLPARDRISGLVDKAARKYQKLMDSSDEAIAERVARNVLVSEGALKEKVDIDMTVHEPLIITKPMAKEVIEITNAKPGEKK